MPEKSIHLERFNTPDSRVKRATGVQAEGRTVTIRQDGRDRLIALSAKMTAFWMPRCVRGRTCRLPARGRLRHL
jgi:hypothetical protein